MDLDTVADHLVGVILAAVEPERLAREALAAGPGEAPTAPFTAAVALGKAAAALARGATAALAPGAPALLVRPAASPALGDPRWEERVGGHPVPDAGSFAAGRRLADLLAGLGPDDRLLALVSGGASACVELPAPGVTPGEIVAAHRTLLASGLPIDRVNAARRRLSALKGGGALRLLRARGAEATVLVLSDVPGDRLEVVASGPFSPGPDDADLAELGDLAVGPVTTRLLAGNATAVGAAADFLAGAGFAVATAPLAGEAAAAGRELVARGRRLLAERSGAGAAVALVVGGETTVRLAAGNGGGPRGVGGRNQELALAAAGELAEGRPGRSPAASTPAGEWVAGGGGVDELVLALATDGIDGPTDAAGARVDAATWEAVSAAGVDPAAALRRHDSATALAAAGVRLVVGPTGTNVADVAVYLARQRAPA